MKIYKIKDGIVIEHNNKFFSLETENWDEFINDDHLFQKVQHIISTKSPDENTQMNGVLAPIGNQEVWACGVTYLRSKIGRQEESKDAGGGDFYARVYEADRPEVFFKSTPHRVVGHNQKVRIRKDSTWDVPEPELTLVVNAGGKIVGYTIGNDMSSRSIEGENPLYLPQAKVYTDCCALGPSVALADEIADAHNLAIRMTIERGGEQVFSGESNTNQ